ncbi:protein NUCLEAR FUSION DEFECTIVE 4-like [Brassica napus]|uniref:protein NUCLEAR FUSION DEFECTIVE 4-like n=1 Tax=Brassica napus TaxID=3708 RepID=UPI002078830C|nr:protein NUCLEAR FUSION DEFECTIVE 4-like [Brassica napus]
MERLGINLEKEPEKGRDTTPYKETMVHNTEDSHPDHEGGNEDQPAQAQPEENPVLSHDQDEMGQPDTEAQEGEPSSSNEPEQTQVLRRSTRIRRPASDWLYYVAYFCGGTIGLVYSNNLGQIAQSLGQSSKTTTLVTLYSSSSFFGRLLSATPDYIRAKFYFARTGWLAIALLPTPIALFLLASSGTASALQVGTALIGLSSGFIFAAAVSITSELFGPNGVGVNHNILITNIPIGSLIYGFLAALVYDSHGSTGIKSMTDSVVCMGRGCYYLTFVWWGCLSVLGLGSSLVLFIRTRRTYQRFEQARISSNIDS